MIFWVLCKPDLGLLILPKAINLIHGRKRDAGDRKQVFFLVLVLLLNLSLSA